MNRDLRNQNETDNPNELDWLAFQYISDDLEVSKRKAFEARLETDTLAQQAVVDAVANTQLIFASKSLVENDSTIPKVTSKQTPATLSLPLLRRPSVLFAAAAALLLLVAGWNYFSQTSPSNPLVATNLQVDDELVEVWADTLDADNELALNPDDLFVDLDLDIELEESADELDQPVEDWMFAALTELATDEGMEESQ